MSFSPEALDLLVLTSRLAQLEADSLSNLEGYLEGKTRLRDAVVRELDCSQLEAEQVVDTLAARGFVRFRDANAAVTAPGRSPGHWELLTDSAST